MTNEKPKKRFLCWVIGMGVSEKDRTPDMAWVEETKEDAAIEEACLEFEGRRTQRTTCRVRVRDLVTSELSTVPLQLVRKVDEFNPHRSILVWEPTA